jgi:hypothetical protein
MHSPLAKRVAEELHWTLVQVPMVAYFMALGHDSLHCFGEALCRVPRNAKGGGD